MDKKIFIVGPGEYDEEPQKEETIGQQFGRLGGQATSKKYGKEHFKELAKKMWEKKRQAQNDTE